MTRLLKTDLPAPDKVQLASSALAMQGTYGSILGLSRQYGISRPTVYQAGATANQVLEEYFKPKPQHGSGTWVWVDAAQIKRAISVEAVMSPSGLRTIEDKLPILYPGIKHYSYGTIQRIVTEVQEQAANFNRCVSLSKITDAALDEMFSQGDPVLAGIDLDSGYLFMASQETSRTKEDWELLLNSCRAQGLDLKVVVKDAARGIAAGVRAVFPEAEQRDDCFHALFEMGKVRRRLAQKAYAAIKKEDEIVTKHGEGKELDQARRTCSVAMALHDQFEQAMRDAQGIMECIDLETGHIRTSTEIRETLESASQVMKSLSDERSNKVGTYLKNRAPGLAIYMNGLNQELDQAAEFYGKTAVEMATLIWRLFDDLKAGKRPWSRYEDEKRLLETVHRLRNDLGEAAATVQGVVLRILWRRNRASSAIEGFNAALRPHLYVHKCVTQGFLDLFQAYFNLRRRRWGRFKGTSPYECLTGEKVDDWLTLLGCPPSTTIH